MPLTITPMGGWSLIDFNNAEVTGTYTDGLHGCAAVTIYRLGPDGAASSRVAFSHIDSATRLGDLDQPILDWVNGGSRGDGSPVNDGQLRVSSQQPNHPAVVTIANALEVRSGEAVVRDSAAAADAAGGEALGIQRDGASWTVVQNDQFDALYAAGELETVVGQGEAIQDRVNLLGYGQVPDQAPADMTNAPGYLMAVNTGYMVPENNARWPAPGEIANVAGIQNAPAPGQGGGVVGGDDNGNAGGGVLPDEGGDQGGGDPANGGDQGGAGQGDGGIVDPPDDGGGGAGEIE